MMHAFVGLLGHYSNLAIDWLTAPGHFWAHIWVLIGFVGQLAFTARIYVQWMASEKAKKSIVPVSYWYLSIIGSFILLAYAIYRMDPVFILGQCFGSTIYFRNIALLKKGESDSNGVSKPA